jgi:hypothetical protein
VTAFNEPKAFPFTGKAFCILGTTVIFKPAAKSLSLHELRRNDRQKLFGRGIVSEQVLFLLKIDSRRVLAIP